LFIFGLLFLSIYVFIFTLGEPSTVSFGNKVLPSLLIPALLGTGYTIVRRNPHLVWSPFPWFLGACAVYYGFGPLMYHFGTQESVWYVDQFYPVGEHDLLRTNMLNAAGITLVILGYQVGIMLFHRKMSLDRPKYDAVMMRRLLFSFLAIGIPIKYFLVLPHRLGLLGWVLPGSIEYLSVLTSLAIIVMFVMVHNGERSYKIPLILFITTELVISLMSLSKLEVIVVLIMILLGIFLCRPRINEFLAGGVLIGIIYIFFLSPFIMFGRLAVREEGMRSLRELSTSVLEYAQEERLDVLSQLPNVQGWWSRLNYANAQAFAMNSYDIGNPGDSYSLLSFTIVPRVLYPEKPYMNPGREFNEIVTGSFDSASGPGIFCEAYWNGGWLFVILSCLYVGIVYAIFTDISTRHIPQWKLAYLPVAFAGIIMGLRPDAWFVATFVGSFIQAIVLYFVIRYFVMPCFARV
jgi:hypothetical protein